MAFTNCSNLEAIDMPSSLEEIGSYAFWGCNSLKELTIPKNVKILGVNPFLGIADMKVSTDGNKLFSCISNCIIKDSTLISYIGSDNEFIIPSEVKKIAEKSFAGNSCLKKIIVPESVSCIGKLAFLDCFCLEEIILPKTVCLIEDNPFANCRNLKNIKFQERNPIYRAEEGLLVDEKKLILITYFGKNKHIDFDAMGVLTKDIEFIGAYSFYNCNYIETINFPDNLKQIDKDAFKGCNGLLEVYTTLDINNIKISNGNDIIRKRIKKI